MNPSTLSKRTNGNGRRPRRWLPYLGAIVLVALLIAGLWPKPGPVETARVTTGNDLPYVLILPTCAATGGYHKHLPGALPQPPRRAGLAGCSGRSL